MIQKSLTDIYFNADKPFGRMRFCEILDLITEAASIAPFNDTSAFEDLAGCLMSNDKCYYNNLVRLLRGNTVRGLQFAIAHSVIRGHISDLDIKSIYEYLASKSSEVNYGVLFLAECYFLITYLGLAGVDAKRVMEFWDLCVSLGVRFRD